MVSNLLPFVMLRLSKMRIGQSEVKVHKSTGQVLLKRMNSSHDSPSGNSELFCGATQKVKFDLQHDIDWIRY